MPPKIDRDFFASRYYASVHYREQPDLRPRPKRIRTPDERTLSQLLAELKANLGFAPPIDKEEPVVSPLEESVLFEEPLEPAEEEQ